MKKAKGFSLLELDDDQNSFQLEDQANQKSAPSSDEIILDILDQNLIPAVNKSKTSTKKFDLYQAYQKLNSRFAFSKSVPLPEKAVFFELISTMLLAGISIVQAVQIFADQTKHKYFKTVTKAIAFRLEKGESFSEALNSYHQIFSDAEVGMIQSGEVTGRLNAVLKRLSQETLAGIELRRKIRSALIYPIIVVFFVIIAVYIMLRFVVPQMTQLFDSANLTLPPVTQFLINSSDFVVNNGFLVLLLIAGFFAGLIALYRTKPGKYLFHKLFLLTPVLKDFLKSVYQAQFARSLSNLLGSGVSVVDSCNITARSVENVVYQEKIKLIATDVAQGITISESIQDSPYFSNLTVSMLSVGEKTAQIDDLAKQVAEYYDAKVADMADNFTKIIQPFIIAIVGTLVGGIVLAIMLPMSELLGGIDGL